MSFLSRSSHHHACCCCGNELSESQIAKRNRGGLDGMFGSLCWCLFVVCSWNYLHCEAILSNDFLFPINHSTKYLQKRLGWGSIRVCAHCHHQIPLSQVTNTCGECLSVFFTIITVSKKQKLIGKNYRNCSVK